MEITIHKLYFVPERAVSGVVSVLRDGRGLHFNESDIPVVSLDSLGLERSARFAILTERILWTAPSCLARSTVSFGCDLSVVSDLKTVRMFRRCRQPDSSITAEDNSI